MNQKNKKNLYILLTTIAVLILGISSYFLIFNFKEKPIQNDLKVTPQIISDLNQLMPTDFDFEKIIMELDSAQKIKDYLNEYFIIEDRNVTTDIFYSPLELFQKKTGVEQDFAIFIAYILDRKQYETVVFQYRFQSREYGEEGLRTLVIFRGADVPKYMVFTDLGIETFAHGWSFEDLLSKEEQRLNIDIYQYAIFHPGIFDFQTAEWIERKR